MEKELVISREQLTEEKIIKEIESASNCLDIALFHVKKLHEMRNEIDALSEADINRISDRAEVLKFQSKAEELYSLI